MNMTNVIIIVAVLFVIFFAVSKLQAGGGASVNASQAQELLKDSTVLILDVRTQQEYAQGHIKGAKLIPVSDLSGRLGELEKFKEKKILVYCRSGNRSGSASLLLRKSGFTNIVNLQGGTMGWSGVGYPLVK